MGWFRRAWAIWIGPWILASGFAPERSADADLLEPPALYPSTLGIPGINLDLEHRRAYTGDIAGGPLRIQVVNGDGSFSSPTTYLLGTAPSACAMDPLRQKLYCAGADAALTAPNLHVVDLDGNGDPVTHRSFLVGAGGNAWALTLDPRRGQLYMGRFGEAGGGGVYRIPLDANGEPDATAAQTQPEWALQNTYCFAVDGVRNRLYVCAHEGIWVQPLDPAGAFQGSPVFRATGPGDGYGMALDGVRKRLYVTNYFEQPANDLYVFTLDDAGDPQGTPTPFDVGDNVWATTLDPHARILYHAQFTIPGYAIEQRLDSSGDPTSDALVRHQTSGYAGTFNIDGVGQNVYMTMSLPSQTGNVAHYRRSEPPQVPLLVNGGSTTTGSSNVTLSLQAGDAHWVRVDGPASVGPPISEVGSWVSVDGNRWSNDGTTRAQTLTVPAMLPGFGHHTITVRFLEGAGYTHYTGTARIATQTISVVPSSGTDLQVTQVAQPNTVVAGENLTFTLTVVNYGPDAATGVVLTNTLDQSVDLASADPAAACQRTAQVVTCALGSLQSGASTNVVLVTRTLRAGMIRNTAAVASASFDWATSNNQSTIDVTVSAAPPLRRTFREPGDRGYALLDFEGIAGATVPIAFGGFGFPATDHDLGHGARVTAPSPNGPSEGFALADFAQGDATTDLSTNGTITSAADLPAGGTAFLVGLGSGPFVLDLPTSPRAVSFLLTSAPSNVAIRAFNRLGDLLGIVNVSALPAPLREVNRIYLVSSVPIRSLEFSGTTPVLDELRLAVEPIVLRAGNLVVPIQAFGDFGNPFDCTFDCPDVLYKDVSTLWTWGNHLRVVEAQTTEGFWTDASYHTSFPQKVVSRMLLTPGFPRLDADLHRTQFRVGGMRFDVATRVLPSDVIRQRWRVTNERAGPASVELVPYLEADLYFEGSFSNDFGAVNRSTNDIFMFDDNDPMFASTYVGLAGCSTGAGRTGYEVGLWSAFPRRLQQNLPLSNSVCLPSEGCFDTNGDGISEQGADVGLALSFDLGSLAPGDTGIVDTDIRFGQARSSDALATFEGEARCGDQTAQVQLDAALASPCPVAGTGVTTYTWQGPFAEGQGIVTGERPIVTLPLGESQLTLTVSQAGEQSLPALVYVTVRPAPDGTVCNDANACTQGDACLSGACVGTPVGCAAPDQCHLAGSCDPSTGDCSYAAKPEGTPCDDGDDLCTSADACRSGACVGESTCAAPDACHQAGACDTETGSCSYAAKPDGSGCDDGNFCTQTDTCQSGACVGANPVVCAATGQCHWAGTCDPETGSCSSPAKSNGATCNDGDPCTKTDTCQSGACVGASPVVCAATDQCHLAGTCDPETGACTSPAKSNGTACNDGNPCTQTDACQSGACVGANPVVCAATDQCHLAGTCDLETGACTNPAKADHAACDDGNPCTQTDTCQSGVCAGANPVVCAALDQCHLPGTCDPTTGACSNPARPNGVQCDDGDRCTQNDTCQSGVCAPGAPVACSDPPACHTANGATCNPTTGTCEYPPLADGTSCSDGNVCNGQETCAGGSCRAGTPIECGSPPVCRTAVGAACNPVTGGCEYAAQPDGSSCSDGNPCNGVETCRAGVCALGAPIVCDTPGPCRESAGATCDVASGACVYPAAQDGTPCSDGDKCNGEEVCRAGACVVGPTLDCDDQDPCTIDACDRAQGCIHAPASNETCVDGGRQAKQPSYSVTGTSAFACDATGTAPAGDWLFVLALIAYYGRRRRAAPVPK